MVGITKSELKDMIKYYNFEEKQEYIVSRCDEWYNNYRFNKNIELKYIKRKDYNKQVLQEQTTKATKQLYQYNLGEKYLIVVLVFNSWELFGCELV